LLSKSSRLFLQQDNLDRSLLADIWVGLCYWRQGQAVEAFIVLARCADASDPRVKFLALVNRSVLQTEYQRWQLALEELAAAEPYLESEPSLSWRGKFLQQRGLSYKQAYDETGETKYLNKALREYEAASRYYKRAGNLRFEAAILNNSANMYRAAGQFGPANANADRAINLYERIADRSHLAHAKDTKALILLDQGQLLKAKRYADQSITALKLHDPAWVTIPLVTRAKILKRMGYNAAALRDFEEAINVAERSDDNKRAATIYVDLLDTMGDSLSPSAIIKNLEQVNRLNPTRVCAIALKVLTQISAPDPHSLKELKESELKTERQIIQDALRSQGGSVSRAAKALGKTHGGLTHIIRTRHKDLAQYCRPIIKRRKATSR
jgi:tetratricopeptide (TPR) repeat protein